MNTTATQAVLLSPYSPLWPAIFDVEARALEAILDGSARIEHIGSTAVPGLGAKPIIDVMVGAPDLAFVDARIPRLVEHGLYFVGLDLIGEKLIEVNVTSPTGIQELARFLGRPVEQDVIRWVEAKVRARA